MAKPIQFIEYASVTSGGIGALASIPPTADNMIFRVDSGTARWSETTGSMLNASIGLLVSSVDPPIRIDGGQASAAPLGPSGGLGKFRFAGVGGAAAIQVLYYSFEGRTFSL